MLKLQPSLALSEYLPTLKFYQALGSFLILELALPSPEPSPRLFELSPQLPEDEHVDARAI